MNNMYSAGLPRMIPPISRDRCVVTIPALKNCHQLHPLPLCPRRVMSLECLVQRAIGCSGWLLSSNWFPKVWSPLAMLDLLLPQMMLWIWYLNLKMYPRRMLHYPQVNVCVSSWSLERLQSGLRNKPSLLTKRMTWRLPLQKALMFLNLPLGVGIFNLPTMNFEFVLHIYPKVQRKIIIMCFMILVVDLFSQPIVGKVIVATCLKKFSRQQTPIMYPRSRRLWRLMPRLIRLSPSKHSMCPLFVLLQRQQAAVLMAMEMKMMVLAAHPRNGNKRMVVMVRSPNGITTIIVWIS